MAKVKVRTKWGSFSDDQFTFTTTWTEIDESRIRARYLEYDKIEVQYPKAGKDAAPEPEEE